MMIKLRRKVIRNPEEVDRRKIESERNTTRYLRGQMTAEEYLLYLKQMGEYLDFRRLAADIQHAESPRIILGHR